MVRALENMTIENKGNDIISSANLIASDSAHYMNNKDYLSLISEEYGAKYRSRVLIFDENSILLADSFNDQNLLNRQLEYQEVVSALRGNSDFNIYNLEDNQWAIYGATPILKGDKIQGAVLISASANDIYNVIYAIRVQILWVSLFGILIVGAISFWLASRITDPIINISSAANRVKEGELGLTVSINNNDELGALADSFNNMSNSLEAYDLERTKFFHNASHELKTPLSSAILLTDSLINDFEKNKEIRKDFLADIRDQLDRLDMLLKDISLLARYDDNKRLTKEVINISDLLENVVTTIKPICKHKNLNLITNIINNQEIVGNKKELTEALINIAENAAKYNYNNGTIELYNQDRDGFVELFIVDTGIGIPKEDIDYVFDRFYRVEKARSRDQGGTGLGLSIAKEIIEAHGGNIQASSEVGKGTTIKVSIPVNS
ncbi:sensor histidine kinase [Candidatus Syntrophocurvum alkaliphilum]|nr:HAMP domain-containing sensor histidine kinase [Candidatus Syntrophocurvum alkaliphilum]